MDQRPVRLKWLSEPPVELDAFIDNMSGQGMRLIVDREIPIGAAIRIDLPDSMLLGEVCYRERVGRQFAVGVKLQHSLANLARVEEMVRDLLAPLAKVR